MAKTVWAVCVIAYEKEVKTNCITEHKHYLQAGGITFAMQVVAGANDHASQPTVGRFVHAILDVKA